MLDILPAKQAWTPEDAVFFTELVVGKAFVSKIVERIEDKEDRENMGQGFNLTLSLYDTTDPDDDILIEEYLVKIGKV